MAEATMERTADAVRPLGTQTLATLAERLPLAFFRAHADGRFAEVSPGFLVLVGSTALSELDGVSLFELPCEPQRRTLWRRTLRQEGRLDDPAVRLCRRSGEERWGRAFVWRTEEGAYEGFLEDVTVAHETEVAHRRQLEQELQTAQRMEAIGSLAGGVAHDFNNVLAVIGMACELMRDEVPPLAPVHERISEIGDATAKATALTQQLLAFSRRQIMWPKSLDLNDLIQDLGKLLRRLISEDIVFEVDLAPALPPVKADPAQLEQVIVNLVVNARDAMPEGGWLRVETNLLPKHALLRRTYPLLGDGTFVHLAVSDTGTGIDEETLPRVFDPFFTTKEGGTGTGLGLSTAYGVVKQSGGFLFAESRPGRGATFRVFLPQAEEPVVAPPPAPESPMREPGAGTILVVEDEAALRRIIRCSLDENGYRVLEASDGLEALDLVTHTDEDIDLVLCDVVMPRMGAGELIKGLRAAGREIPFLSMSGYGRGPDQASRQRDSGQLKKPFSVDDLLHKVASRLAKRRGSD